MKILSDAYINITTVWGNKYPRIRELVLFMFYSKSLIFYFQDLTLLINLVENNEDNRNILMESKAPPDPECIVDRSS